MQRIRRPGRGIGIARPLVTGGLDRRGGHHDGGRAGVKRFARRQHVILVRAHDGLRNEALDFPVGADPAGDPVGAMLPGNGQRGGDAFDGIGPIGHQGKIADARVHDGGFPHGAALQVPA